MNNYSPELKIKIVKEYLNTDTTYNKLAEKYCIPAPQYIGIWVRQLKNSGEVRLRNDKKSHYSTAFKIKVISYMYNNNISALKASIYFGIGHTTVLKWNKIYLEKGMKGFKR